MQDIPIPRSTSARIGRGGWRDRLRLLLRPRCPACALAPGEPLCAGCTIDYFPAAVARCAVCASRLPAAIAERCGRCLAAPPNFDASIALADYLPPVDRMLAALKFGARLPLAAAFGTLLAQRAAELLRSVDAIVPVPLAFERHAERGFNQAHEIARRCATLAQRPLRAEILLRTRHAPPQMGLARAARRRNVRGAFAVRAEVSGLRLAVIDDVMTTGSTLDEIAGALKGAGAGYVVNLVVARTP